METLRLRRMQEPSRIERLLEAYIRVGARNPRLAVHLRHVPAAVARAGSARVDGAPPERGRGSRGLRNVGVRPDGGLEPLRRLTLPLCWPFPNCITAATWTPPDPHCPVGSF